MRHLPGMIFISPSPTADSRTARGEVTKQQLLESTKQHICDVQNAMTFFFSMINRVARDHDHTKIEYMDDFYWSFSREIKKEPVSDFKNEPWYQRHISEERHHIKDRCPEDVDLIDVLEHISDIVMAGLGRHGHVEPDSIDPAILERAYQNTIKLLTDSVEIRDWSF